MSRFVDPLLEHLNEPQHDAVLYGDGPLLVLAGAGSGKTRVITHRIAHLVMRRAVAPWKVLAVTFTNKAAREMRERLEVLLGPSAGMLTVSTFHSASAMLLRREAEAAGLSRNFVIYDDGDQLQVVKRAIREAGVEVSSVNPRELLGRIEAEKNAGRLPHQMLQSDDPRVQTTHRVYRAYQSLLKAADALDFGDLLLLLVELLRTNEEVRLKYQRRFQYVLVDEFQDTNPVQYQLLKLLAPPGHNVCVVGDDDQSIYRWRGAEVDNILHFPDEYPGCKVVKLEQNYRSDQVILEAAHAVIDQNKNRMAKKLWSARARGEQLALIMTRDERGEAQEVARRVQSLRLDGVCDYAQMAVFFRTNAQSRILEETFRLQRVPYVLVSGRSFYDRSEIRDAASYLRLMLNPKSDADLERVVNTPARGIGDTTMDRVRSHAGHHGISLYEALADPESIDAMRGAAAKKLRAFRELMDSLVRFAQGAPSATDAAQRMLQETGLIASHVAEGTDDALSRAENLRELLTATQEFDRLRAERLAQQDAPPPAPAPIPPVEALVPSPLEEDGVEVEAPEGPQGDLFAALSRKPRPAPAPVAPPPPPAPVVDDGPLDDSEGEGRTLEVESTPLQAFLEQVSLVGDADGDTGSDDGRVSLMTLHAAKGLEFDAVFLTGMEEDIFPHRRATKEDAEPEDMAEERRLCYVGFTRARRRLHVSFAQCRTLFGEMRFNPPSRFLSEVPQELFDVEQVEAPPPPQHRGPGGRVREGYSQRTQQQDDYHQGSGDGDVEGLRVMHKQFGEGVVVDFRGTGQDARLTVRFATVGLKTIVARYLTPL